MPDALIPIVGSKTETERDSKSSAENFGGGRHLDISCSLRRLAGCNTVAGQSLMRVQGPQLGVRAKRWGQEGAGVELLSGSDGLHRPTLRSAAILSLSASAARRCSARRFFSIEMPCSFACAERSRGHDMAGGL